MKIIIYICLFILFSVSCFAKDDCLAWFKVIGVSPSNPDCELKCATASSDMSTFMCSAMCEKFCKSPMSRKCSLKESWIKKIKGGLPKSWPYDETPSSFSPKELEIIKQALQRLSDAFPIDDLEGIYKLERARSLFSVGTPSTYIDRKIVLYQKAFDQPEDIPRILIHELAHHLHEHGLQKEFSDYKISMKWTASQPRPGPYLDSDGKDSPEEDFANNFEAYVIRPKILKAQVSIAFDWMKKRLKNKFQMKECEK